MSSPIQNLMYTTAYTARLMMEAAEVIQDPEMRERLLQGAVGLAVESMDYEAGEYDEVRLILEPGSWVFVFIHEDDDDSTPCVIEEIGEKITVKDLITGERVIVSREKIQLHFASRLAWRRHAPVDDLIAGDLVYAVKDSGDANLAVILDRFDGGFEVEDMTTGETYVVTKGGVIPEPASQGEVHAKD